ncbi:sialate O-acetylesterase [candidate division KSB1 bacterium]|nr:sialate O-acetylesterase [candidate division KSB1 bacterium]
MPMNLATELRSFSEPKNRKKRLKPCKTTRWNYLKPAMSMKSRIRECRVRHRHSLQRAFLACQPWIVIFLLFIGCQPWSGTKGKPYHLFLLIGQSNMAGRGELNDETGNTDPRILMLNKDQEWQVARHPLHFDKPIAGTGLALSFARAVLKTTPDIRIGLIPCAVGGSSIAQWQPGKIHPQTGIYPFDAMIKRIHIAQKNGHLQAILWHQGESDSKKNLSGSYEDKLYSFIVSLRDTLQSPGLPFIAGELGPFYVEKNPHASDINAALHTLKSRIDNYDVVSASGLTHNGDSTHFDTLSLLELGKRYADSFIKIQEHK